jgi:hypothetical protein
MEGLAMEMNAHALAELWPVLLSIVFLIVWLIRLEAKVLYLEKEHEMRLENDKEIWNKFDNMQKLLSQIMQSLARLEGKLEGRNHD